MKRLITIPLYCVALFCLVGCESWFYKEPILSQFEKKPAEQIYQQGEAALRMKKYNVAVQHFKALNTLYKNNIYAESAHLSLIDCYESSSKLNSYNKLIQAMDDFIRLYPDSKHVSKVRERKAKAQRYYEHVYNTSVLTGIVAALSTALYLGISIG